VCDVFKSSVAAIVPEANGSALVGFRRAIGFTFAVERAVQIFFRGPLHVIANDEIEFAVFIKIDPGSAGAEFLRTVEAGFLRDIGEGTVAVVMEEVALAVRCNKEIVEAVVVKITHGGSHTKNIDVEAGFVRDIGERAVVIVVVELRSGMFGGAAGPVGAIHQKNIRPSIVIIVDKGNAGAQGFWQIFFAVRAVVVREANPRLLRDVAERGGRRRRCWSGTSIDSDSKENCQRRNGQCLRQNIHANQLALTFFHDRHLGHRRRG
jgi:hypothetical protein